MNNFFFLKSVFVKQPSGGRVDLINKLLLPPFTMFMTAVNAMVAAEVC